jgi:hypothetical protein
VPKLNYYSEKIGCGATIQLDSGEGCIISVAQTGVMVRSYRKGLLGAAFGSFIGPKLYKEEVLYKAAATAMALDSLFPEYLVPVALRNPVLAAFANAVWQCSSAAEVSVLLNTAVEKAGGSVALPPQGAAWPSASDGESPETAIFVNSINSIDGIAKEYELLDNRFGKKGTDWKVVDRFLVSPSAGRTLEKFILSVHDRRVVVYFDISGFVHDNGPNEKARLDAVAARYDGNLEILVPKELAVFLMTFTLKLTDDQLEQLGWTEKEKNALVGRLVDALKPFLGRDYEDIPLHYPVAMMLSQWAKGYAFLRLCKPQDLLQEEDLENLKAFIDGALKKAKAGN